MIRDYLERSHLKARVEARAPGRAGAHLTHGDVVVALVTHRLTAPRPRDDIVAWAAAWAGAEPFGISPTDLNDERVALDSVGVREASKPADQRTSDHGQARTVTVMAPAGADGVRPYDLQRLFSRSREERAAGRRNRARWRARAEAEIGRIGGRVGSRRSPPAERARAKIAAILEQRRLTGLAPVRCAEQAGRPAVGCAGAAAARARAAARDGDYGLETPRPAAEADARALLAEGKGPRQIEQRQRSARGPLRIRPLVVTSHRRIVGLITIPGIALMVFSLIERAARRTPGAGGKLSGLLAGHVAARPTAGHVAARPTGENILKALRDIALVHVRIDGEPHRLVADLSPLQRRLLDFRHVPKAASARIAA